MYVVFVVYNEDNHWVLHVKRIMIVLMCVRVCVSIDECRNHRLNVIFESISKALLCLYVAHLAQQ